MCADAVTIAYNVGRQAIGEIPKIEPKKKNRHAVALGIRGGFASAKVRIPKLGTVSI